MKGHVEGKSLSLPLSRPTALGGVFLAPFLPPNMTTAAQKKTTQNPNLSPWETLPHPNETILWGFATVWSPPSEETFSSSLNYASPPFTRPFVFFRWDTTRVFFLFLHPPFHIQQHFYERKGLRPLAASETHSVLQVRSYFNETSWTLMINHLFMEIHTCGVQCNHQNVDQPAFELMELLNVCRY